MNQSATQERIGKVVVQSSLAVYGVVWLAGLALWLEGAWLLAAFPAAAYVAMHVFEFFKRGRCWTSADASAVPVSAAVYLVTVAIMDYFSYAPLHEAGYLTALFAYCGVLMAGHVVVLGYVGVSETLLLKIFRRRIEAEKQKVA